MKKKPTIVSQVSNTTFLKFKLKEERFVVNTENISDILEIPSIIKLPGSPEYLRGIIIFSKVAVPVVDLRLIMKYPRVGISVNSNIILFRSFLDHKINYIGALVDSIEEIVELELDQVPNGKSKVEKLVSESQDSKYNFLNPQYLISPEDFLLINNLILKAALNTNR
ncbi:hypothetical protein BH23BAC1_BH23BAC1_08440 [soil metagenome]